MATSRPFAYNTGSTISGTEQIGDLAIGVDDLDYDGGVGGVTWWSGPDEDLGYVICRPNVTGNQPNPVGIPAYVRFLRSKLKTEESFVNLVNTVFNQTFTTGDECKTYLNNNGYWTSWVSSIKLYLDASNPSSYSGAGTTWYDLSGNGNDVEMVNSGSITWNNSGPTYFSTGSDGWFSNPSGSNLPIGNSNYTFIIWVQLGTSWNSNGLMSVGPFGGQNAGNAFRAGNTNQLINYWWGNDLSVNSSVSPTNDWFNAVAKYDGITRSIWVNGEPVGSDTPVGHNVANSSLQIAKTYANEFLNGNIGEVLIYDTALSDANIEQYFNNTSPKYFNVTPTPTPTNTLTPTPTVTSTNTPTPTPTVTSTNTPTPTVTSTNTPTPTPTPTPTGTTADFIVTVSEVGPDVVWSGSGSFNLAALSLTSSGTLQSGFSALPAIWAIGPSASIQRYGGASLTGYSTTFGSNLVVPTPISSGSTFGVVSGGITSRQIVVPSGYTSNTFISGTATYTGATIASMGLTPGTYTWAWGSGANSSSIVMTIEGSSVTPTPTPTNTVTPTVTPTNTPTVTPTITPSSTPNAPVTSNLRLYYDPSNSSSYSGSGTVINDLSGNGLNGTMSNITFTSPYFSFDGSSSQVSVADNALLEPGSGDWTIEFWVNHSVIAGSGRVLIGKTDGGNAADWGYGIRTNAASSTYMEVGNGTTSITSPSTGLSINTWYQVVGVWTNVASNSLALYINGSLIGSNSHSVTSIKNTTSPLYIGSFNGGQFAQWLNGRMGVVRMYNSALTASEILQNFNADKSKYGL